MNAPANLGYHPKVHSSALTKQEVSAWLCREGLTRGYWAIPEYEVDTGSARPGRIDIVWALKNPTGNPIWLPIAAFEIEGHDVAFNGKASLGKDLEKLAVAKREGASTSALILFQIAPDGSRWKGDFKPNTLSKTSEVLSAFQSDQTLHPTIILDEKLPEFLHHLSATIPYILS